MKLNKLYYAVFAVLFAIGCEDEFLTEYPTGSITPKQIADITKIDPNTQGALLAGIYENIYKPGSGGTDGHTDFGQRSIDIKTDMLSGDMVLGGKNYGWYSDFSELTVGDDYTSTENYTPWRFYYRIVNLSNLVIDSFGGRDTTPESDDGRHSLGQALTTRGYAYFYLTQLYQNEYDATKAILPIYSSATQPNQAKSTAAEVYKFIEDDLKAAKTLMTDFSRESVSQADQYVASAVLALTYGAQGKWQDAADESAVVVLDSGYELVDLDLASYDFTGDPVGGFNNVNTYNKSVLWGIDLTTDSNIGLLSWWGQCDYYSYSYAAAGDRKIIDSGLAASILSNDTRLYQFTGSGLPIYKFYHEDRVFFGQRTIEADYFYFRFADMLLLHAEAQANLGNDTEARAALASLLSERLLSGDSSYLDALSGQALIDEVYLQTRIELWGEGKSYLAMKRNKATITRGSNWLDFAGESFSHNDEDLTFEIPEEEIRDNPLLNNQN
jgi:hypothetical protein